MNNKFIERRGVPHTLTAVGELFLNLPVHCFHSDCDLRKLTIAPTERISSSANSLQNP